ncbi:cobalamin adenosyltransferase [Deltaproteobacteria bacterium Smac51]|nr:cobalamin adenosyltransferase [Deltaproteobacteria bacterium Smac51]
MNTAQQQADIALKSKAMYYGPDGGELDHKPESCTHLRGRRLVRKDHPIIIWRGKLDSLAAHIIQAQEIGFKAGNQEYVDELEEILDFVRRLLSHEYIGQPLERRELLGLDADALRERSHDPAKFYGHGHMMASYKMGSLSIALNGLRTFVREVETSAVTAFQGDDDSSSRDDIVMALNRLSSLFYIMMYKYLPKGFRPESAGI